MLKAHPRINVDLSSKPEYPITIFMLLDCDAGPMELTQVNSLLDFYILYQSKRNSRTYDMAVRLLNLGYQLQILRINDHGNRTSLMLTKNPMLYSHPEYNKSYVERFDGNVNESYMNISAANTYGYKIHIPSTGILSGDYILFNIDNTHWYYIVYGSNPSISTNIYYRIYEITNSNYYTDKSKCDALINNPTDAKIVAEAIADVISNRVGLYISDIIKNEDNSYTINCYSTEQHYVPQASLTNNIKIIEDNHINYDVLCQYLNKNKTMEFYSKHTDATSYLNCKINKLGSIYDNDAYYNRYNIIIEKITNTGSVIYTENYDIDERNGITYNEDLFNINSRLVTCKITNLHDIPNGSWKFDREVIGTDADISDHIRILSNTEQFRLMSADLVLDSGMNYIDYEFIEANIYDKDDKSNKDKIELYDQYISKLEEICESSKLLFTSFNPNHKYKNNAVSLFIGTIDIDNINYPAYFLPLYLLSKYKDVDGKFKDNFNYNQTEYEKYLVDNNQLVKIEYPEVTNYEIKLINPLCYFMKSEVSLDQCIKTLYTINTIRRELNAELFLTEDKARSIISEICINMTKYFSRALDITTEKVNINDRYCEVTLSATLSFDYRKYFELTINLS